MNNIFFCVKIWPMRPAPLWPFPLPDDHYLINLESKQPKDASAQV